MKIVQVFNSSDLVWVTCRIKQYWIFLEIMFTKFFFLKFVVIMNQEFMQINSWFLLSLQAT